MSKLKPLGRWCVAVSSCSRQSSCQWWHAGERSHLPPEICMASSGLRKPFAPSLSEASFSPFYIQSSDRMQNIRSSFSPFSFLYLNIYFSSTCQEGVLVSSLCLAVGTADSCLLKWRATSSKRNTAVLTSPPPASPMPWSRKHPQRTPRERPSPRHATHLALGVRAPTALSEAAACFPNVQPAGAQTRV